MTKFVQCAVHPRYCRSDFALTDALILEKIIISTRTVGPFTVLRLEELRPADKLTFRHRSSICTIWMWAVAQQQTHLWPPTCGGANRACSISLANGYHFSCSAQPLSFLFSSISSCLILSFRMLTFMFCMFTSAADLPIWLWCSWWNLVAQNGIRAFYFFLFLHTHTHTHTHTPARH